MKIPRLVIAGTNSGCGKTSISMGIMAALAERGMKVQPYKAGPDYIDPMFHTFITGRASRNLDSWLLAEDTIRYLFAKNATGADIAVVEGVMGLYDGYGGSSLEGSTADVARIVNAPVILVINGEAMSLSAAALVKGFATFDKNVDIKGVIINNLSGEAHYRLLKNVIEENTGIAVAGYLKKDSGIAIGDRHLGLVTSAEVSDLKERTERLVRQIEETVDLELLLKLAGNAPDFSEPKDVISNLGLDIGTEVGGKLKCTGEPRSVKIGVAMDKAFCFYYRDNLDLLEMLGAELVFFSPLNDSSLPADIDGLYMGGGYPEVWAEELQANISMRNDIKRKFMAGLPSYAECGGFMYLCESIEDMEGRIFDMAGVFPGKSRMGRSLDRFGYIDIRVVEENVLAKAGMQIRAHEFHYSSVEMPRSQKPCYAVSAGRGEAARGWSCGYKVNNVLAGYPHIHFWANPEFAKGFVRFCGGRMGRNLPFSIL